MEERITSIYERSLTTTVNDIEHMESQSIDGRAIIKVFFQPGADINAAVAQVSAISQPILRQLPPGASPPFLLTYNASSVPIVQLGLARARTQRAGAVRLWGQLHPHPPGDYSRAAPSLIHTAASSARSWWISTRRRCSRRGYLAGRRHRGHRQPESDHSRRHLEDRPVRIRRGPEFQPHHRGGVQRFSGEGGERVARLHPRHRPRARRFRAADQHRAPGRQPRGAAHGDEGRERFHAGRGGWRAQAAAGGGRHAAAGIEDPAAGRSIHLCARFHQWRDPRSGDRGVPYRA